MSAPRSALAKKRLKNQFGIRAKQVAIRGYVPKYWYVLSAFGAILLGALLVLGVQALQSALPKDVEITQLRGKVAELNAEVERLNGLMGTAPNALLMAESAKQVLAQQLEKAQADAAKAKEDLAYCEKLSKREAAAKKAPIFVPGAGTIPASGGTN